MSSAQRQSPPRKKQEHKVLCLDLVCDTIFPWVLHIKRPALVKIFWQQFLHSKTNKLKKFRCLCEQYFICHIERKSFLMGDVNVAVLLQDAWSRQLPMFANSFACKSNLYTTWLIAPTATLLVHEYALTTMCCWISDCRNKWSSAYFRYPSFFHSWSYFYHFMSFTLSRRLLCAKRLKWNNNMPKLTFFHGHEVNDEATGRHINTYKHWTYSAVLLFKL